MEINNNPFKATNLQNNGQMGQNKTPDYLNDLASFRDAAKVDITDLNVKAMESRELSNETQQFLSNNNVDMAKDSTSFDKQNILVYAGSYTVAQGHASAVSTRQLLS